MSQHNRRPQIQPPKSNDRGAIALHMDAEHDPSCALYVAGNAEPLSKAERKELLERVRAGEHIELELEAVPFIQRSTPNRNFVRFPPGKLPGFAKSYEGMPFLKDHATYDLASRGGTVIASKLEHNEDGSKSMRMRIRLVKPWAVESALDGTLDRFSIGWDRNGMSVQCSIHLADFWSCSCRLGATLEDGRRVELLVPEPTGTEVSGVNVPAVVGTNIESISQLGIDTSRLADTLVKHATSSVEPQGDTIMDPKLVALFAVLGCSATSVPDDAIRAAEKLERERDEAIEERDELRSSLKVIKADGRAQLTTQRKATTKAKLASLVSAGKLKPGSKREDRLRARADAAIALVTDDATETQLARATADFDDFVEQCDELLANGESVTPAGAPLPAAGADPAPVRPSDAKAFLAANPTTASWLAKAGISEEDFAKHGTAGRETIETLQNSR